jgi:hypothetical protein
MLCQAASRLDVVVSELAWMGTKIENIESKYWWRYEWFELYNNTPSAVSLEGWKLELYRSKLDFTIKLEGSINPGQYFTAVSSDKIFPLFDQNYSNLSGKFFNGGMSLLLKDQLGEIIDDIDCSSGWFGGDNATKQTMERKNPLASGGDKNNWTSSKNSNGTPGKNKELQNNASETTSSATSQIEKIAPAVFSSEVMINEILPSPEGPDEENEWIEIFNNAESPVDLSGWQITDTKGAVTVYRFPDGTKIEAKDFLVLKRPETKIILNNENDGINLVQPDSNILQKISYENAPLNQSYNKAGNKWAWNKSLTPGAENAPLANTPEKETSEQGEENNSTDLTSGLNKPEAEGKNYLAYAANQTAGNENSVLIFSTALLLAAASGISALILKKVATK